MATITFATHFDYPALFRERGAAFALVTDTHVEALYGRELLRALRSASLDATLIAFPAGEVHKTRATKEWVEDRMLEQKLGRDSCLIALGGGVVTDLAGFVAATYCRGIPFFSIPTTLLGMVDAAIGGKTGANVPQAKNQIGAFHTPEAVLVNPNYLLSLSDREMQSGLAEVIKHGLIGSLELIELLECSLPLWQSREAAFLEQIILKAAHVKEQIVRADPFEQGLRRLLNFGHTIGHAIEVAEHYALPHGEAVAIGMAMEAELSVQRGYLSPQNYERICSLLCAYGFEVRPSKRVSLKAVKSALALDKKSLLKLPRLVLLQAIGQALSFNGAYCTLLKEEEIDALPLR